MPNLPESNKRRLMLILHGGNLPNEEIRLSVETLRQEGVSLDVRVTWEAGDAARFAKEAVKEEYDVAVAGGGDGTLNEIVNGIFALEEKPSIAAAVLPLGTANDFATACGLMGRTIEQSLRFAAEGPVQPIDVGRLNGHCFINVVSGGFGAEVTANTPAEMKKVLGGAAYSLMGLITALNFRPYEARVQFDEDNHAETLLMLAVGNGRQSGGGYQVAPKAKIDDGLLDVVLARDTGFSQWRRVYQEMADPDLSEYQFIDYQQVRSFTLDTDEAFQMNLDGEPLQETQFKFDLLEKALPFVLPTDCPLLTNSSGGVE